MNVKEAEKEVVIPVAESAGTVLKNLYDGKLTLFLLTRTFLLPFRQQKMVERLF